MPRIRLTTTVVERIKPPMKGRLEYADNVLPGLSLRVTDKGGKSWSLHYRVAGEGGATEGGQQLKGKLKRMTLGRYPLIDLTEARKRARAALDLTDGGIDPVSARWRDIATRREAETNTFGAVASTFIERYRKRQNKPQTWREGKSVLDRLVLPRWKERPITDIHQRDVIELLDHIVERHRPHAANKVLKEIRRLFTWAVERELIKESPVIHVSLPTKERARDRVLADHEIVSIWRATEEEGFPFGTVTQMLLITAQRRNEVAQMRWPDLDLKNRVWAVPREATKSDRAHEVPLSPLAIEILESLPRFNGDYVFSTTGGEKPVSGFSKAKRRVDALSGVGDWRLHDLRRTATSGMAKLGTPLNVMAKVLNHSSMGAQGGVTAIYNRYQYDAEKRQALEGWSRYLADLHKGITHDHGVGPTTEP